MILHFRPARLSDTVVIPAKSEDDAGYDLGAAIDFILPASERIAVPTNLQIEIPKGYYGRIAPRSGLALNKGIDVLAGVIDPSYRGEICVILVNLGKDSAHFLKGDRIAQLIIEKYYDVEWKVVDFLNDSTRGEKGFGSTGV